MRWLLGVGLACVACLILLAAGSPARAETVRIDQAVLVTAAGERGVDLPHRLAAGDFAPDGSTVTYRLSFAIPPGAAGLQAIYLSKVSLSARVLVNGAEVWVCGTGDLAQSRCLHQPHLIPLPAALLSPGENRLELEVFADGRQMNGLSPVLVGPYADLHADHYVPARFLKVELLHALAILAGVAGLMSLAAGFAVPGERGFFLFAAAAIMEALSIFLMIAVDPPGDRALASWLIFNARYVGVALKLLLIHQVFDGLRPRDPLVLSLVVLIALGPVVLALTGSDRNAVLILYLLLGLVMTATVVRILMRTLAAPTLRNMAWALTTVVIFGFSVHDYLRLGGTAPFDGVYLLYYVFPLTIAVMGSFLFVQMGHGLRVAQSYTQSLSREVAERTAALESALASIQNMETSALSLTRNIPIGTFILQTWGRERASYAFFSDRLRQMIDLPPEAEPPLLIRGSDLLHPDDAGPALGALHAALDTGSRFEAEFRIHDKGGNWRWLRCIMLPQDGTASPVIWDGVVIDVTEARIAEDRLRAANAGLVEAAARQSRIEERERLLQDIHDGFGSQLSSARLAMEQGNLARDAVVQILLECSEDLRLTVDTLGNEDGDLNNAMADFRYRVDRRLFGTGIDLAWDIDIPEDTRLPPTHILHLLRILQEAKNNALRHAGARHLRITVTVADGRLSAVVADDGGGIDPTRREGRGMANMRKRCREIGARLQITSDGRGTRVTVTMDVPDAR